MGQEDQILDSSIDRAVRLRVMIDVSNLQDVVSDQRPLTWADDSIAECLKRRFSLPQAERGAQRRKVSKIFTACNLKRVAGIEIV
ncbi:hypothetical protein MMC17_005957 [Xylographa soralifera]|nr:hypothetical protein [Xylographa soralifera]